MINAVVPVRMVLLCGRSRRGGAGLVDVVEVPLAVAGDEGFARKLGDDASARADAVPGRAGGNASIGDVYALQADALGSGRDTDADATQGAAGLSTAKHLAGQQRTIALDFNVDVVFDGQRHDVLRREIEIAGAQQGVEA